MPPRISVPDRTSSREACCASRGWLGQEDKRKTLVELPVH